MNEDLFQGIREAIADALEIEKNDITMDKKILDFANWDSLGFVKVIMSLSKKFGKEMDAVQLINCKSISEIYEYVASLS